MANITDKVSQIRQAVYGKDVRESIASGIEAINSEVVSTTNRQDIIDANEQSRINNENIRKANEVIRSNNENDRITTFETNERDRESTFETNERNRISTFEYNEAARQQDMNTFMKWYTDSQLELRLPVVIDGGNFTDAEDGKVYDGGDW